MSSQVISSDTEAAILARALESDAVALTPEAARYLLSVRLPLSDRERVDQLSAKARTGTLTERESQELDSYLHVGCLLAVMQSKARRVLKDADRDSDPQ